MNNFPRLITASLLGTGMAILAVIWSLAPSGPYTPPKPTGAAAEVIRMSQEPTPAVKFTSVIQGQASYYDYDLCKLPSGVIVGRAPSCLAGETLLVANYGSQHPTCAARFVPRGTFLLVRNVSNGLEVLCKVNDYGPDASVHPDRDVDLSLYSFSQIASLSAGVIKVEIKTIQQ